MDGAPSGLQGGDFGVVFQVVLVPAFAGELAGGVEQDAADGGIGRGERDAATGEREGAVHPGAVLVGGGHESGRVELSSLHATWGGAGVARLSLRFTLLSPLPPLFL